MSKCQICQTKPAKHKLTNARHLTGETVCMDSYQSFNEDELQRYLFDDTKDLVSYDFDKPLDYEEFKEFLEKKLGYESATAFYHEIGMNPRSAVQTWKKKKEIPFLVRSYLQNKIDKINKVDVETKFVELTKEIPEQTFEKDNIQYKRIADIDDIVEKLTDAAEDGCTINGYNIVDKNGTILFHVDNCYEKALFEAIQEQHISDIFSNDHQEEADELNDENLDLTIELEEAGNELNRLSEKYHDRVPEHIENLKDILKEDVLLQKDKTIVDTSGKERFAITNEYEKEIYELSKIIKETQNDNRILNMTVETLEKRINLQAQELDPSLSSIRFTHEEFSTIQLIMLNIIPAYYEKSEKDVEKIVRKVNFHREDPLKACEQACL